MSPLDLMETYRRPNRKVSSIERSKNLPGQYQRSLENVEGEGHFISGHIGAAVKMISSVGDRCAPMNVSHGES